jgi:hypothetical protein
MAGKGTEPLTTGTDLKYPWVDLVTASMMPLMYFNITGGMVSLVSQRPAVVRGRMDEST